MISSASPAVSPARVVKFFYFCRSAFQIRSSAEGLTVATGTQHLVYHQFREHLPGTQSPRLLRSRGPKKTANYQTSIMRGDDDWPQSNPNRPTRSRPWSWVPALSM